MSEYETLVRNSQRVGGQDRLVSPLVQAGITDPEAVNRMVGVYRKAGELGVDPLQLLDALGGTKPPAAPQQTGAGEPSHGLTAEEATRLFGQLSAKDRHDTESRMQSEYFDSLASRLSGDGADAQYREVVRDIIDAQWLRGAQLYPEGHPLRDSQLRPMTAQERASFEAAVDGRIKLLRAQSMMGLGQSAGRSVPAGAPQTNATGSQPPNGPKPWAYMSDNEKKEALRQEMNRHTGGPVSQAV